MIREIVKDFIEKDNSIIVSAPGNGASTLSLYFSNLVLLEDKIVVYFNPTKDIDRNFIKTIYPQTFKQALFMQCSLELFIDFLQTIDFQLDYLFIDSGDILMVNKKILPLIMNFLTNTKIIITSQIRQNIKQGGQVYSPIEQLNKEYSFSLFKYSIWIRNVSEEKSLFVSKYLDVFEHLRQGNNYIRRYIIKSNIKTGVILG